VTTLPCRYPFPTAAGFFFDTERGFDPALTLLVRPLKPAGLSWSVFLLPLLGGAAAGPAFQTDAFQMRSAACRRYG